MKFSTSYDMVTSQTPTACVLSKPGDAGLRIHLGCILPNWIGSENAEWILYKRGVWESSIRIFWKFTIKSCILRPLDESVGHKIFSSDLHWSQGWSRWTQKSLKQAQPWFMVMSHVESYDTWDHILYVRKMRYLGDKILSQNVHSWGLKVSCLSYDLYVHEDFWPICTIITLFERIFIWEFFSYMSSSRLYQICRGAYFSSLVNTPCN